MTTPPTPPRHLFARALKFLLPCILALGVFGCATSASRLSYLHVGMSRQDVIKNLGEPHSAEVKDGTEYLYFNLSINRVAEGMFCGLARPMNIGKRYYKVEIVDGRLRSYYKTEKP